MIGASACVTLLGGCSPNDDKAQHAHPLELAASERGLINSGPAAPMGIFERRQGAGRERLCVVRSGDEGWRFAAELRAGDGTTCLTRGDLSLHEARQGRDTDEVRSWKLRFRGLEGCEIDALAQGDILILPDHLPAACSKLCAGRVHLAGAELERTSWADEEARHLRLRGAGGSIWTECGSEKAG